jgi:ribosome-binding factor A
MGFLDFHIPRLAEQLQKEISIVITQEMRDPRIPTLVTITRIKLAQDTRNATVYVSIYGETKEKNEALAALNGAAPFIQRVVAGRVTVKHFPRLCFKLDNSIEYGGHINELLKEVKDDLE